MSPLMSRILRLTPFSERTAYSETEKAAMNTLAYFDIMNLADRVKVPVLMSIGLIDRVTPPSTVFAVYNHLETKKN